MFALWSQDFLWLFLNWWVFQEEPANSYESHCVLNNLIGEKKIHVQFCISLSTGSEKIFTSNIWYIHYVCVCAQSCLTHCDLMDCSPPGSSVHGIFQARIPEWVAMSFSRGSFWLRDWTCVSCVFCIGRWVLNVWEIVKVAQSCPTLCNTMDGIFPTQGSKSGVPHWR